MNLTLYFSIERIGLGLAVTLEFLGPLAVALGSSRSRGAVLCAVVAALGVLAITHPEVSTDYVGVGLALAAACCWATYILLNKTIGQRIPGLQGTAMATALSATGYLPVGIILFTRHPPSLFALGCALCTGLLASALPYAADTIALRHLPAQLFGVLMSINPIFAALVGAVLLQQSLGSLEWIGVVLIVAANAAALTLPSGQPVERRVSSPVS
jgi:inner membrane transporter RhtA